MNKYKIGTRTLAGFVVVLLINAAVAAFTIARVTEVSSRTDKLATNYFPSSLALSRSKSSLNHEVSDLVRMIASQDPAEIAALNKEISDLRADIGKQLAFYESTPFTPEEAEIYDRLKATRAKYLASLETLQRLGQTTDPAEIAHVQVLYEKEFNPLYVQYQEGLQQLLDFNKKGANDGMAAISGAAVRTRQFVYLGLALAILFSLPIAFFVVRSIVGPLGLAVAAIDRIAANDLTVVLAVEGKDEIAGMAKALNRAAETLRGAMQQVNQSADSASSSSRQLAAAAISMADGAQQQAASIEETSASLEEITASVRQSADSAREANRLALESRDVAERGQSVVVTAVEAMGEINAASAQIAAIIATVNEIAFQTNLLAVNAAVEAARAGEQGRGFAVVATEVRSLAQRSAAAAKQIKDLIQDSLSKVEKGSQLVNESGETLSNIVASFKRVTDIVGEIAGALEEQSTGVQQVSTSVSEMDQVTQQNAAQTEELSSTAESLSGQSSELLHLVAAFKLSAQPIRLSPGRPSAHRAALLNVPRR